MRKILLSITTTSGSDWRKMVGDINELGLKEAALFPTCLDEKERKELYRLVENSSIKSIPFVHIRNDMGLEEMDYLIKKYNTKVFNTHSKRERPMFSDYSKHKNIIYIENVYHPFDEQELKDFAGICLDFSHLETDRLLYKDIFDYDIEMMEKYPIGCNHISAIKKETRVDEMGKTRYDEHHLEDLSELDYLKRYPLKYFSDFVAIELENSIKEQITIKDYISDLLQKKD